MWTYVKRFTVTLMTADTVVVLRMRLGKVISDIYGLIFSLSLQLIAKHAVPNTVDQGEESSWRRDENRPSEERGRSYEIIQLGYMK